MHREFLDVWKSLIGLSFHERKGHVHTLPRVVDGLQGCCGTLEHLFGMYLGDLLRRKHAFQLRQTTCRIREEPIHDSRMGHVCDGPLEIPIKEYDRLRRSFP